MGFDDIELPTSALDTLERTRKLHQNPDETFKPSMLIDLEKGRPMELEVVVGYVIEKAKELKVDVPVSSVSLSSLIVKKSLRPVSGRDSS